jgi:hypothetical protein
MKNIHLGNIICGKLKELERTKKWLAKQVGCDQSNLCKILQKGSMDTDLLLRISFALHCDLPLFLSNYYNENQ